MVSCDTINSKYSKILQDVEANLSPYPISCDIKTIAPLDRVQINQIKKQMQEKINKICTPSMTEEKLTYLRKLWVKQYMIDAYPELYPEPKEYYLTKEEMAEVEKMYELE